MDIIVPRSIGFPIEGVNVQGGAIITDLDGNTFNEIYYGSDSVVYGKWMGGLDVNGFPFDSGAEISTSISSGDLDGDGDKEKLFLVHLMEWSMHSQKLAQYI